MTLRPPARLRALSKAGAKHWQRLRRNPRLLPQFIGKAWRVLTGERRLDAMIERNRLLTDWAAGYEHWPRADGNDAVQAVWLAEATRALRSRPRIGVVVTPRDGEAGTAVESLAAQVVRADAAGEIAAEDVVAAMAAALGDRRFAAADFLGPVDGCDRLAPDAIARLALELAAAPDATFVYTDDDRLADAHGRRDPWFKPAWDPALFLQQNFVGRGWFARRDVLAAALAAPLPANEWELLWRIAARVPQQTIGHLPRVLYHGSPASSWMRDSEAPSPPHGLREWQQVPFTFRPVAPGAWYARPARPDPPPVVSVIVPTRNRADLILRCAEHVFASRYPDFELVIVDNGSDAPDACAALHALAARERVRVIAAPGPFNFAALNNAAARAARGQVLCFLNDDAHPFEPDWLDELVAWACLPDSGVVGARLLYADGTIQHAGVLLGAFALTHHLLLGRPGHFAGYHDRGRLVHAVSGVTAACAAIRRSVFDAVGGFDEALPAAYNDIDLCLAAGARGLYNRIVQRPLARHLESATRGYYWTPEQERADEAAKAYLLAKWGEGIRDDIFYNPNLALDRESYALASTPRVAPTGALRFVRPRLPGLAR